MGNARVVEDRKSEIERYEITKSQMTIYMRLEKQMRKEFTNYRTKFGMVLQFKSRTWAKQQQILKICWTTLSQLITQKISEEKEFD